MATHRYIYDRPQELMYVWEIGALKEAAGDNYETVLVEDVARAQTKWVGLEVLEGPLPEVDYSFDQLRWELEVAESLTTQVFSRFEEALPKCLNAAVERMRTRQNPPVKTQAERLKRMRDFILKVEACTGEEVVLLGPHNQILDGWHIVARAIMDEADSITAHKAVQLPTPAAVYNLNVWIDEKKLNPMIFGSENPPY